MKRRTPLEILQAEKASLENACRIQEQKLNESFSYLQENAGSVLLSGLSSLLFPGNKSSKGKTNNTTSSAEAKAHASTTPTIPIGLSDYLSIAKGLIPVAWEIAQPFIMSWGIKKAKRMLARLFAPKKKV